MLMGQVADSLPPGVAAMLGKGKGKGKGGY
jgi:hypothetical protein